LNLARGLSGEQPFYGIQPHGLDGGPIPPTIEAMAACHLQTLRAFQPAGPYLLGGYCNGGLIAFEMARQLQAQGERVDLLVLLCASASNVRYKRLLNLVNRIGRLKGLEADAQMRQFLTLRARAVRVRGIWNYYKQRLGELSRMATGGQMTLLRSKALKAVMNLSSACRSALTDESPQAVPSPVDQGTQAAEDHRLKATAIYSQAILSYVPKPYAGRIAVLWPSELALDDPDDPSEGWRKVAAKVETHSIPGGHITCVTRHVHELAGVMRACLEKAQASDARQ
jgi:thioesterase domain-containing protein